MNNPVENDFFWISQGTVATSDGEVDKSERFSCQIFSGFNLPKIIRIGYFLTELLKKIKGGRFLGHGVCTTTHIEKARCALAVRSIIITDISE